MVTKNKKTTKKEKTKHPWPTVRLGDVCKTVSGGTPLRNRLDYYEDGKIPWLKSGEVNQGLIYSSEEKITESGLKNSSAKKLPVNTVLVAMYGATAGKVGLLKIKSTINQAICGVLPCDKFVSEFLYMYLSSQTNHMSKLSSGGAQLNISQTIIKNLKIPLPPLEEQKKIAVVLSKIQQNIDVKNELIEMTKELKKSVMKHLFTYGVKGEQTKQTEIGKLPKTWKVSSLDKLFYLKQGQSLSSKNQTGNHLKYFLRTSNVLWSHLDLSKVDQMDILPKNRSNLLLQKDDLLICEGGDIGRTAIWNGEINECYFQNHIHRLRAKDKNIYPLFYMYWMDAGIRVLKVYGTFGNRTTIPNLSGKRLLQFSVPLPPLEEQKAIAGILQKIDERIQNYEDQKASLQDLFKSMLNKLMTAQIRLHNIHIPTQQILKNE